jgi:hypothetical protein
MQMPILGFLGDGHKVAGSASKSYDEPRCFDFPHSGLKRFDE